MHLLGTDSRIPMFSLCDRRTDEKRQLQFMVPVYEELFEQVGRSRWGLCYDQKREDWEAHGDGAELLEVIRKWEANVQERMQKKVA